MASLRLKAYKLAVNALNNSYERVLSQKLWTFSTRITRMSSNANIMHTIQVKEDIDRKRKTSLLGGGLDKIEAQHRKVWHVKNAYHH